MVLNMGLSPSLHAWVMIVTLDGEDVEVRAGIGLHPGHGKNCRRTNIMYIPYVSRWDYAAGMFNKPSLLTLESWLIFQCLGASYIRVIMLELNRIANHLLWLGPFMADVGSNPVLLHLS